MTLTAEQLELRRHGLGGSDIAAVLGLSQYRGPVDVQQEKMGTAPPFDGNDRTKWGQLLEPVIRTDFAHRHGVVVAEPGTLVHPDRPWMIATPDGVVYDGERPSAGLEIKTRTHWLADRYGDGGDELPFGEIVQSAWSMAVTRAIYGPQIDRWHVVIFLDGLPADFLIHHDQELESMLVDRCGAWWQRHIVDGEAVPPDGHERYAEFLKRAYPHHDESWASYEPVACDIDELISVRAELKTVSARKDLLEQRIKEHIGPAAGIEWPSDGDKPNRITWRRSKDSQRTDWKATAIEMQGMLALRGESETQEVIDRHTTPVQGSRRFVVPREWSK